MNSPISIEQLHLLYSISDHQVVFLKETAPSFTYVYANPAALAETGTNIIGKTISDCLPVKQAEKWTSVYKKALRSKKETLSCKLKDVGKEVEETTVTPIVTGQEKFVLCVTRNMGYERRAELDELFLDGLLHNSKDPMLHLDQSRKVSALNKSFTSTFELMAFLKMKTKFNQTLRILESYKTAINHMALVTISEPDGTLTFANEKYLETTQFSKTELLGTNILEQDAGNIDPEKAIEMKSNLEQGKSWQGKISSLTKAGSLLWVDAIIIPLTKEDGSVKQVLSIRFDITDKMIAETNLRHMAFHDSLTKLPNRRFLINEFDKLKQEADAEGNWLGILYIDGDNFKQINDVYGHSTGDEFICRFGQTLKESVRTKDLVGRIGGDEFLIVLRDINPAAVAEQTKEITERIRKRLNAGWVIDGQRFCPSATIGISFYPKDGRHLDALVDKGDIALMEAKKAEKGSVLFYSEALKK